MQFRSLILPISLLALQASGVSATGGVATGDVVPGGAVTGDAATGDAVNSGWCEAKIMKIKTFTKLPKMSSTEQRIISSEYPLAPLESFDSSLEWTDEATGSPQPNQRRALDEQAEQYYDAFEYCDQPMTYSPVASQDLILRGYTEHTPVTNTLIIICHDHCKVTNGAGFGSGQPCAENFCPNSAFVADSVVCFGHAMDWAMYDAKQRYRASREAVALERARDEREAAAAALFVLNTGVAYKPMPDPELYMKWYNEELDKWYAIKATERLLAAAKAILPGEPADPLRQSIRVTAQTFLDNFTAPKPPVDYDSEPEL
ncbi:hypothetical protein PspLS_09623 [Pyricularia sp. CBS 133598]|nr:hypothetical protein PspLS_09623 [Pyricularia sp. CBS 133598]